MLAQVVLVPAESKKLIAQAVARMQVVKRALEEKKMIVIHPSSSTYFLVEELTGKKPRTDYWICGSITPKGMCQEMGTLSLTPFHQPDSIKLDPGTFPYSWVIKGGDFFSGEKLSSLLERMGPEDVYVKGVNAVDSERNVGVLVGHKIGAGTIGRVIAAHKKKAFQMIFVAGLEKLIPIPVLQAAKEANRRHCEYGMGMVTGLVPCRGGTTVTEIEAIEILSGAQAVPIAGGGVGGAEGAITLMIKGEKEQVKRAIEYVERSKGAKLPQFRLRSCYGCPNVNCRFPLTEKPWT